MRVQKYYFLMEHKDTKTQRLINFWFLNIFFAAWGLCILKMLSEDYTKGFLNLAYGVEGDVVFLAIETLEIVFGDYHVSKTEFLSFGNALFDAVDRANLTRKTYLASHAPA